MEEKLKMSTLKKPGTCHASGSLYRSRSVPENISGDQGSKQSFHVLKDFIANFGNWRANKQKRKVVQKRTIPENDIGEFDLHSVKRVKDAHRRLEGGGHLFVAHNDHYITWCDLCGETIWGFVKRGVRCQRCKYTCHLRCKDEVLLECDGGLIRDAKEMSREEITLKTLEILSQGNVKKNAPAILPSDLSPDRLLAMIQEFNKTSHGLIMTLSYNSSGDVIFQGFVRVAMNLLRPISIVAGERPLSIFEAVSWRRDSGSSKRTKTSFFLPPNTMKALHITSDTTAQQVIVALLGKYKISDHPRKFALYERHQDDDDVTLRRIADDERPLVLRLMWGGADRTHSFCLQENETGDIMWEAFSIPELQNFIRILEMEEREYIKRVWTKYRVYRDQLEEAMAEKKGKSATS